MSRDSARDYRFRQLTGQTDAKHPCLHPIPIYSIGLPSLTEPQAGPIPVELEARCRKCSGCLAHRRRLWTARAVDEIIAGKRSWFGTLTINPHWRFVGKVATQSTLLRRGVLWDALDTDEQFSELVAFHNKEITKFLKRVRQQSGQPLRYLLVSERHKTGDPHFHLLLHEPKGEIRKALLEKQWRYGFSHWRLVDRDTRAPYKPQ